MNSIDNLRDYVLTAPSICSTTRAILVGYIDNIEREVDEMWHALTIDAKPMTDENMAADGWVRLPVDADGVPIHVGDVVAATLAHGGSGRWVVDRMELTRAYDQDLWQIALDKDGACWVTPSTVRHHHAPTVEDVLYDLLRLLEDEAAPRSNEWRAEQVAECAAKLRLAGEG